jgi:hypothetical protein
MAVGDVYNGLTTAAASTGTVSIQPTGTQEVVIHNIYHASDISLAYTDGTTTITFDSDIGSGVYAFYAFHVTSGKYIKVTNTDTSSARAIGYDGIVTHV